MKNLSFAQRMATIIFALWLALFLPLLSYKITLSTFSLNEAQTNVVLYLKEQVELENQFTQREREHLADVKNVMKGVDILFGILAVIIVIGAVYLYNNNMLGKGLFLGGITGAVATSIVILINVLNFNGLFNQFHLLFFEPGSWVFSVEDRIIQLFPLSFFTEMTKRILIITLLLNGALSVVGWIMRRRE